MFAYCFYEIDGFYAANNWTNIKNDWKHKRIANTLNSKNNMLCFGLQDGTVLECIYIYNTLQHHRHSNQVWKTIDARRENESKIKFSLVLFFFEQFDVRILFVYYVRSTYVDSKSIASISSTCNQRINERKESNRIKSNLSTITHKKGEKKD